MNISEPGKLIGALAALFALLAGIGVPVHNYFAKEAELQIAKCGLLREQKILTAQVGQLIARAQAGQRVSDIEEERRRQNPDSGKIEQLIIDRDAYAEAFRKAQQRETEIRENDKCV
jgi:hypothetical protein